MSGTRITKFQWQIDLVDKASKQLLANDRHIRRSIEQTGKEYDKQARTAERAGGATIAVSRKVGQAARQQGRAAAMAKHDFDGLTAAQRQQIRASEHTVTVSQKVTQQYRRQATAARELARAEQTRGQTAAAAARRAGSAGMGGAAVVGGAGATLVKGGAAAGIAGIALATAAAAREGTNYNKVIDAQGVSFRALLKDQEKAAAFQKQIGDLAIKSPILDIQSTGNAARSLMAYGVELKNVLPLVKAIGDMSAASGQDISEVMPRAAMAIGQVAAKGKLQSQEMNQLAESVKLSRDGIRKALGMTRDEFEKSFTPGNNIKADKALPAILKAMRNQSAGAADDLAKTTAGRLSRAREVIARGFGTMTKPLYDGVGSLASNLADRLAKLDFKRVGDALAAKLKAAVGAAKDGFATGRDAASGLVTGLQGRQLAPTVQTREAGGLGGRTVTAQPTRAQQIGQKVGAIARQIGTGALTAGKQLLDAFRPALPFFQNILLPLLKGVAKGVGGALVTAFRVIVPAIKFLATGLGWLGEKAKPLKGVFEKIGMVIGFVFAGPILKVLGFLPKVGGAFRVAGTVIGGVGKAFGLLGRGVLKGLGFLARINPAVIAVKLVVNRVPVWIATVVGKAAAAAKALASGILKGIGGVRSAPGRVLGFLKGIPGKIREWIPQLAKFFFNLGAGIVRGIVAGIKSAPGAIKDAVVGTVKSAPGAIKDGVVGIFKRGGGIIPGARRGGLLRRYQGGGLVDAMVSPGEDVYMPGGGVWTVPGARVAADSVHAQLPAGAAVITGHGQQLLSSGASMAETLANQLPHFANGGIVSPASIARLAKTASGGKLKGGKLVESVAISLAESGGNPRASLRNTNGSIDRGLWQINSIHGPKSTFDPLGNAKAMWSISGHGKTWQPWVAFLKGRHTAFMDRARKGVANSGSAPLSGGGGGVSEHIMLGRTRRRAGLVSDALSQGLEAGRAGLTRGMISAANRGARGATANPLLDAIRSAWTATTRKIESSDTAAPSKRNTTALGNTSASLTAAMTSARRSGLQITSTTGGKHTAGSWHYKGRAFDASNGTGPTPQMMSFAKRMAGRYGSNLKELFYDPLGWYVKNGKRVAGSIGGHSNHVHVAMRRGGMIPRFRGGGTVPKLPATGALEKVDEIIGGAANMTLERLRRQVLTGVRAGGTKAVVQRLQAVLSLIDAEIGRRIGMRLNEIDAMTNGMAARRGQMDRRQRRLGIDPGSSAGLATDLAFGQADIGVKRISVNTAKSALKIAKRTKDADTIAVAQEALDKATEDLDEAITARVEKRRDQIRQAAQDVADAAQFNVDLSTGGLGLLDAQQRVNGTSGTPAGLIQRSAAIRDSLLPALQGQQAAAIGQRDAAAATGDLAGVRSATLSIQQASTDIASAIADAADLVKQAALDAAQNLVDVAQHGTSMQQLQLQRIELEQRLQGVYDGGGQTRADFINTNLLPSLQAELTALVGQQAQAQEHGDQQLARQIAEAIAGKQNELLQAQLDALEQVAENTDTRDVGGGTLSFAYAGGAFTDQIINAGTGA